MRLELSEFRLKYASLRVANRAEQARLKASIATDEQQSRVAVWPSRPRSRAMCCSTATVA